MGVNADTEDKVQNVTKCRSIGVPQKWEKPYHRKLYIDDETR
jgi:hypothetical protein